jgi:hypothetical protein
MAPPRTGPQGEPDRYGNHCDNEQLGEIGAREG